MGFSRLKDDPESAINQLTQKTTHSSPVSTRGIDVVDVPWPNASRIISDGRVNLFEDSQIPRMCEVKTGDAVKARPGLLSNKHRTRSFGLAGASDYESASESEHRWHNHVRVSRSTLRRRQRWWPDPVSSRLLSLLASRSWVGAMGQRTSLPLCRENLCAHCGLIRNMLHGNWLRNYSTASGRGQFNCFPWLFSVKLGKNIFWYEYGVKKIYFNPLVKSGGGFSIFKSCVLETL